MKSLILVYRPTSNFLHYNFLMHSIHKICSIEIVHHWIISWLVIRNKYLNCYFSFKIKVGHKKWNHYRLSQKFLTGFLSHKTMKKCLKTPINFRAIVRYSKAFPLAYQGKNFAWSNPKCNWKKVGSFSMFSSSKINCFIWYKVASWITQEQQNYRRTLGGGLLSWKTIFAWVQNFQRYWTVEI